jgi:hypothetical protein
MQLTVMIERSELLLYIKEPVTNANSRKGKEVASKSSDLGGYR